jgi:NTE family protein
MQYVYGYTCETMAEISGPNSLESMRDWTLPLAGLFHGKKARHVVSSRTMERNIEDLWLPCFTVATNLTRASCELLNRGPVDDAILASSRVPGMFPPIVRGEDLLVDGGLMSNVPADLMKPFCGGPVIAVDVSSVLDFKAFRSQHSDISGWKLLFDRMRRAQDWESTPSIVTVLMRSMGLDSEAYRERMRAISDLYLTPPVRKYRLTDFKRGPEMAEEAYRYAYPELERWWSERNALGSNT